MPDQTGKTAWITGASSGIGEALAKAFVADGGYAILSGRRKDALQRVAQESGAADRCMILPFEATDYDAIPALVEQAIGWQGQVDILVNNAGISQRSMAVETQLPVYQKIIDVDLVAPIALTQALLGHMVGRGGGAIINISSIAGKVGSPQRTAYSAAKHGIIGYGDALRCETAALGMQVMNVAPGSVRTDVARNALLSDGAAKGSSDDVIDSGIDPADVAQQIWQGLADDKRELVIAKEKEAMLVKMRAEEPENLFNWIEQMVAKNESFAKRQ